MRHPAPHHASGSLPTSSLQSLGFLVGACFLVGAVLYLGSRQIDFQPAKTPPPRDSSSAEKSAAAADPRFAPDSTGRDPWGNAKRAAPEDAKAEATKPEEPEREPKSPTGAQRARLIEARATTEQAAQRVQQLQAELVRWRTGSEPLATNDAGRRLAADPAALDLAESVWSHARPNETQITAWRDQLAVWQDEIHGGRLDTEAVTQVAAIAEAARKAAVDFETDRLVLETLIEQTQSQAPGPKTLQESLHDRRLAAAILREDALRQAAQAVHDRQTEALQQLQAEVAAKEGAVEQLTLQNAKRRLDDKLLLLGEEGKADAQTAQRARERLQLVKNFERDLPQVKQYLAPFLADGFKHRENAGGTKGPASYNKLVGQGALESTRQGMESLILMATRDNDRPAGPFPVLLLGDFGWSQYPKAPVEKAQALLTKYGSLMVELKLLTD